MGEVFDVCFKEPPVQNSSPPFLFRHFTVVVPYKRFPMAVNSFQATSCRNMTGSPNSGKAGASIKSTNSESRRIRTGASSSPVGQRNHDILANCSLGVKKYFTYLPTLLALSSSLICIGSGGTSSSAAPSPNTCGGSWRWRTSRRTTTAVKMKITNVQRKIPTG